MFNFKGKQRRESFICVSNKTAIETIFDEFKRLCSEANMQIPKGVDKVSFYCQTKIAFYASFYRNLNCEAIAPTIMLQRLS